MSILDTFFILFESDASKLDKGLSETEKKTEGLEGKLKSTDAAAGKLGTSLTSALVGLAAAATAALSVSALSSAIAEAARHADHLDETAQRLGLSVEALSMWGDLVTKSGGSADGFAASIEGLNKQLAMIEVTGKSRAAPFLKELGINLDDAANAGKSAMDFLPPLADAFSKLDATKAQSLGARLGFDQATIMTLRAGRREVEELLEKERELGVVTKEQGEIAAAFGDQMDDMRHSFRSIWLGIMEYVLPPLTSMMRALTEGATWARKHSDFFKGLAVAIGVGITTYALPALVSMASTAAMAAASFLIMYGPILLVVAGVTALAVAFALVYDDIVNFMAGNDSLIGQMLTKYPQIGKTLDAVVEAFNDLLDIGKAVAQFFSDMWNKPGEMLDKFLDKLVRLALKLPGMTTMLNIAGFDAEGRPLRSAVAAGQAQLNAAAGNPLGAQTSNSLTNSTRTVNRTTSVQVGKVEVQTQATDAAGISRAIGGSMEAQMRQAVNNFDDGVLA